MAEGAEGNGINTWIDRLAHIADVAGKISGGSLATILLGLVIAAYFGWISSPLMLLPRMLEQHDIRMISMGESRLRIDQEVLQTLTLMREDMAKSNRAYRMRTCADIRDVDLRRRCLDS